MGAKLYADSANKKLVVTETPDGDGFIQLNVQVDVWSDLILDWESDLTLRGHTFPIVLIGAEEVSAGKLGSTYVLLTPWQIAPYEADHDFDISGNLFTESALTKLVQPTVGAYTVTVTRNLSTLVEVVETGTTGLTPTESQQLDDIDTNVVTLLSITNALKTSNDLTNEQANAEHTTSRSTGKIILRNTDTLTRWEADAFEDEDQNIPYGTNPNAGIESAGMLVEVAWS